MKNLRPQQTTSSPPKPKAVSTKPTTDAEKSRFQSEQKEVEGHHKNDGQKDHKGAR